jgi:hypothetical protein
MEIERNLSVFLSPIVMHIQGLTSKYCEKSVAFCRGKSITNGKENIW